MGSTPDDQASLPKPRLGFYGVIDERMDLALIAAVADARPDWTLVLVGPVVKIHPADLPRRDNIVYLGGKAYADLPAYLAGWDVARFHQLADQPGRHWVDHEVEYPPGSVVLIEGLSLAGGVVAGYLHPQLGIPGALRRRSLGAKFPG